MPFPTKILIDSKEGMIEIGKNCRINGAYIHAKNNIKIGDNCVMASGVNIIDTNGHELLSLNRTVGEDAAKPIVIGNNVWIGINAVVLKGTMIGDNSVVAAGSVVKGSFPPCSLIQGNPAKVVSVLQMDEK
ncbi:MAG: acyltransferase [Bacteroidales bacterium]|nr:acyltransferase [Bacteroidales bacterium]